MITRDEYIINEINSEVKHEYMEGEIVAMAGASFNHNFIFANLMNKIGVFLEDKNCYVLGADLRVTTLFFDSYMYPDITIVCDKLVK
jgi:Uma2 family endonuclease